MGTLYWFVNFSRRERVDFPGGAKLGDIANDSMTQKIITHYLTMRARFGDGETPEVAFVPDSMWDKYCTDLEDATCDVLYDMFEDGWIPKAYWMSWIFEKFQEADRLKELGKWMEKFELKEIKE